MARGRGAPWPLRSSRAIPPRATEHTDCQVAHLSSNKPLAMPERPRTSDAADVPPSSATGGGGGVEAPSGRDRGDRSLRRSDKLRFRGSRCVGSALGCFRPCQVGASSQWRCLRGHPCRGAARDNRDAVTDIPDISTARRNPENVRGRRRGRCCPSKAPCPRNSCCAACRS